MWTTLVALQHAGALNRPISAMVCKDFCGSEALSPEWLDAALATATFACLPGDLGSAQPLRFLRPFR